MNPLKSALDRSEKDEIIKHAVSRNEAELKERKIEAYRNILKRKKDLRESHNKELQMLDSLEDKIFNAQELSEIPSGRSVEVGTLY